MLQCESDWEGLCFAKRPDISSAGGICVIDGARILTLELGGVNGRIRIVFYGSGIWGDEVHKDRHRTRSRWERLPFVVVVIDMR